MPSPSKLFLFLFAATASAQTILHVDPRSGVDQVGGGGPTNPLKTLTFAVTQSPGPATFRLRPGVYSEASGETFPIVFQSDCTIEGDPARVPPHSNVVQFDSQLALTTSFAFDLARGGTAVVRDVAMGGGMFRALRMDVVAGTSATLVVQRCRIGQSRCVVMNVASGAVGTVVIGDSVLAGPDNPVIVAAAAQGSATVVIERSVVESGLRAGVYLDASGGGSVQAFLRASRIGDAQTRGIGAVTDAGGSVTTRIEHCLLHGVGIRTIGGVVGAIVDSVGARGQMPQHVVVNSILHGNRADAPAGNGANYAWGSNLVSQANLVGIGGNRAGTATFVDPGRGDYHLLPGSAGIDAGQASDRTTPFDLDGDPYLDAAPDLGPDEAHFGYVVARRTASLGGTATLRPLIAPAAPFVVLLASDRRTGSFGPGAFHLAGVVADVGLAGVCDQNGVGALTVPVPTAQVLHLKTLYFQAGTTLLPVLGANAAPVVLKAP